jgi:ABC-2 type transport system permease protein
MFTTLLRKELREQHRTFKLWILVGVLVVSGMISPLLARYTPLLLGALPGLPPEMATLIPEPTILDSFTQYLKNGSQFGLIVVIVLTMGLVAQEIERGTAAMLLVRPVSRAGVILAKWAAGVLAIIAGVTLGATGFAFYTVVLFGPFSFNNFLLMNALLALFLVFYHTLALFASSLARSQAMAAAAAFAGLLLILIVDALPRLGDYLPGQFLSWSGSLFSPVPQPAWGALLVSGVLMILFLALAILRFSRLEI